MVIDDENYLQMNLLSSPEERQGRCNIYIDVWIFSQNLEDYFRKFDDTIIKYTQYCNPKRGECKFFGKLLKGFAYLITALTTIEMALGACLSLYLLGADDYGNAVCVTSFVMSIISQIPKRFIFRLRPYMATPQRAIPLNRAKTSSFPSRAVTGGVVYAYLISACLQYYRFPTDFGVMVLQFPGQYTVIIGFILVTFLLSSWSRIFLGVHYPTDCIAGALQGIVIIIISYGLYQVPLLDCGSCTDGSCYGTVKIADARDLNYVYPLAALIVGSVVVLIVNLPPLSFWSKSVFMFGGSLSFLIFRVGLLCPVQGYGLFRWDKPSFMISVIAPILGVLYWVLGVTLPSIKVKRAKYGVKEHQYNAVCVGDTLMFGGVIAVTVTGLFCYRLALDNY